MQKELLKCISYSAITCFILLICIAYYRDFRQGKNAPATLLLTTKAFLSARLPPCPHPPCASGQPRRLRTSAISAINKEHNTTKKENVSQNGRQMVEEKT